MPVGKSCSWRRWKVQRLFLLSCVLVGASSLNCFTPCQNCDSLTPGGCPYGLVDDTCFCCTVCGLGPGEDCGDEIGFCGRGLECYKDYPDGLTDFEILQFPGVCRFIASPPNVTTASRSLPTDQESTSQPIVTERTTQGNSLHATVMSTAASPTTSLPTSALHSNALPTAASPNTALATTETVRSTECRYPTCSVDYCTGSTRHRICSAKGLAYARVASRGTCQHTSCRACFLYIKPPCTTACRELPTKQCLKRYYMCVDNHMLYPGIESSKLILRLTDPNIASYTGRIICYVPEVVST